MLALGRNKEKDEAVVDGGCSADGRWWCLSKTVICRHWLPVWAAEGMDWTYAERHAGGRVEPMHHPYRNAFSGRTTSKHHFHFEAPSEVCWEITCLNPPSGGQQLVDVVTLVEWMIKYGWQKTKTCALHACSSIVTAAEL